MFVIEIEYVLIELTSVSVLTPKYFFHSSCMVHFLCMFVV